MGRIWSLFVYFHSLPNATTNIVNLILNRKSVDGVLGFQTWDCRMVAADEFIELRRHPIVTELFVETKNALPSCPTFILFFVARVKQ